MGGPVIATSSQYHPELRRRGAGCLLALTLALSPAPLKAEPNAAGQAALILSKDELKPEERRKALAAIGAFCYTYANAVPRLSPREQDWLDLEMSSQRTMLAMSSLEFSKWIAGERAHNCANYAITLSTTTGVVTSSVVTRQEVLLWTLLAWNLLESDFRHHVSRLAHAQLVLLSEDQIKMSGAGPLVGRLIIENVIIPYLDQK
jgi:hypothetical protein